MIAEPIWRSTRPAMPPRMTGPPPLRLLDAPLKSAAGWPKPAAATTTTSEQNPHPATTVIGNSATTRSAGAASTRRRTAPRLAAGDTLGQAGDVEDRVRPRTRPRDDVHSCPDLRLGVRQHAQGAEGLGHHDRGRVHRRPGREQVLIHLLSSDGPPLRHGRAPAAASEVTTGEKRWYQRTVRALRDPGTGPAAQSRWPAATL